MLRVTSLGGSLTLGLEVKRSGCSLYAFCKALPARLTLAAVALGKKIVNQALVAVGKPKIEENPEVNVRENFFVNFLMLEIQRPGSALIHSQLYQDIAVSVQYCDEVVWMEITEESADEVQKEVERVLRSEVTLTAKRWSLFLELKLPEDDSPWGRTRYFGMSKENRITAKYEPYAT